MIAWIGSIALSLCAIPLAWSALKKPDTSPIAFLVLWTIGEFCLAITYWNDPFLILNYLIYIICLLIVWWSRK